MKLNKSSSYVLLSLLTGSTTAAEIKTAIPDVEIRTIQRSLSRLVELGVIEQHGPRNDPRYTVRYDTLLTTVIPEKLLEDPDRPETGLNFELIAWLRDMPATALEKLIGHDTFPQNKAPDSITAKELEYLTIELSWKSSALEGNTYTLLDTQLLITEGIKAKNRTEFETQMILNHKNAIGFIVEHPDLFAGSITFATIEELHKIIGANLGIPSGVRKRLVKISASNYTPLTPPQQLREQADQVLQIVSQNSNPYVKSLLALSLIPYLQIFEDGNKRTGRMLANAILISTVGHGFSLRRVDARELALAYLAFYEFNSMAGLVKILQKELNQIAP